ncbi:hypothetical protein TNCV_4624281 [Trichonephila clavipes]|nr:hypothetical protein TNCV_4624281 [Trichonephila clavipes]
MNLEEVKDGITLSLPILRQSAIWRQHKRANSTWYGRMAVASAGLRVKFCAFLDSEKDLQDRDDISSL